MINETKEMTFIVTKWAYSNLSQCNVYENLKEAIRKTFDHWETGGVDVSENTEDLDVQSFQYILKRVKECNNLYDYLDFKSEVEEHYETMPRE